MAAKQGGEGWEGRGFNRKLTVPTANISWPPWRRGGWFHVPLPFSSVCKQDQEPGLLLLNTMAQWEARLDVRENSEGTLRALDHLDSVLALPVITGHAS